MMSDFKLGVNQQAFLAALRSGKFKQTKEVLEDEHGHCCLGVGCVVAENHGVEVRRSGLGLVKGSDLTGQPDVIDWLGLYDVSGAPNINDEYFPALVELNDHFEKSFNEIANYLEANAEYYFRESK